MSTPYRHIAVAIDDSRVSRAALEEARRVWDGGPGRLSVVHVAEPPPYVYAGPMMASAAEAWQDAARAWLRAQVAPIEGAEAVLLTDEPTAEAVVDWAARSGVDLIVAGAYRGPMARALRGSFARHLAYNAKSPVLLVGPGMCDHAEERSPRGGRRVRVATPDMVAQLAPAPA